MYMNKKPSDTLVVVAMSGGVDSSTVAALLHEQGYKVIGITLQLYDYGLTVGKKGACCAGQDIYDAKMVSDKLGIPHYVLDYESKFKQSVIEDFVDSYIRGETPLPCVRCNQSVKFHDLMAVAKELNADMLATGHYIRKINSDQGAQLHMAVDSGKDQSYFLFATTKEQLEFLYFPLGAMTKEETRQHAERFGLQVAHKADSQDICFVPNGKYGELVAKLRPESTKSGKIIHIDGYEVGEHQGIINYTIGQRRGLRVSSNTPLYVVRIDAETQSIFVGPESALAKQYFSVKEVNWLGAGDMPTNGLEVTVKVRSTQARVPARLYPIGPSSIEIELLHPEKAISPGQACVFYDDTRVLGGGWITSKDRIAQSQ